MPRSDREIFDDHVTSLLRRLGIDVDGLAEHRRRSLLTEARQRRLNAHEAALTVAYRHIPTVVAADLERARVLADRLALTARTWHREGLVDAGRFADADRDVRRELRDAGRG